MKKFLTLTLFSFLLSCGNEAGKSNRTNQLAMSAPPIDFYSLNSTTIDGQPFSFSSLKGKR
ncbi:MAG: hypothetical protein ACPGYN_03720, partial [Schleiferiaceae bacterium]